MICPFELLPESCFAATASDCGILQGAIVNRFARKNAALRDAVSGEMAAMDGQSDAAGGWDRDFGGPAQTAKEFWREHDARRAGEKQ